MIVMMSIVVRGCCFTILEALTLTTKRRRCWLLTVLVQRSVHGRSTSPGYVTDGCRSGSKRHWMKAAVNDMYEHSVVYPDVRPDNPIAHTL